eukprot:3933151-Pleurochrysis_carterae.AAC.1
MALILQPIGARAQFKAYVQSMCLRLWSLSKYVNFDLKARPGLECASYSLAVNMLRAPLTFKVGGWYVVSWFGFDRAHRKSQNEDYACTYYNPNNEALVVPASSKAYTHVPNAAAVGPITRSLGATYSRFIVYIIGLLMFRPKTRHASAALRSGSTAARTAATAPRSDSCFKLKAS